MKFDQSSRLRLLAGAVAAALPFCAAQAIDMMDSIKSMTKPPKAETREAQPSGATATTDTPPTGSSADHHGTAGPQGPIRTEDFDDRPANELPASELPANEAAPAAENESTGPIWERVTP